MTIVIARRFGERICVMSDTMISCKSGVKNNIIPGQLKSIIVNKWLTISYAGLSIQAIDAVRAIYRSPKFTTDYVIVYLKQISQTYFGELDFIIISHEKTARLIKISNNRVFEGADLYWIGSSEAVRELSSYKLKISYTQNVIPSDETLFIATFIEFMKKTRSSVVGGAVIDCLCSPYGHTYKSHSGVFSWDTINLGKSSETKDRDTINKTGMYQFEYDISRPLERGIAIIGFYLRQAKTGFIYDPIHYDDAMKIVNMEVDLFNELVISAGATLSSVKRKI